jgi:hypothetical protein
VSAALPKIKNYKINRPIAVRLDAPAFADLPITTMAKKMGGQEHGASGQMTALKVASIARAKAKPAPSAKVPPPTRSGRQAPLSVAPPSSSSCRRHSASSSPPCRPTRRFSKPPF